MFKSDMSLSGWLIAGSIFIIILVIAIGIGWWIRNKSNRSEPVNPYEAPLVWSNPPAPSKNTAKNTCQLYTFPTSILNVDGYTGTVVPGTPSFNQNILDNLQGKRQYPVCLDTDQIIAQQLERKCIAPNGVLDGSITRCLLINGGTTGIGGTEIYYSDTECNKIPQCAGQLSLVSVNFQGPSQPDIFCMQSNGTGGTITMNRCDPSNTKQLFRITRIDPFQNPRSLKPGNGQNGLLAQILDRETGLCVIPGNDQSETVYNPEYLTPVNSGCSGSQQVFIGSNLVLGPCVGGTGFAPGYVWAFVPSFPYCPIPGNSCQGCTGCTGCTRILGENVCSGCNECTGNAPSPVPPQIIYTGDINFDDVPIGNTGYQGITGPSALLKWLVDNNGKSLYFGGTGGLILTSVGTDVDICIQKAYTSQYINLPLYNTIIDQEVCLNPNTSNCTSL
jgi:hypothetical protein